MEQIQLEAFVRHQTGKGPARTMRRNGNVPAVFYGPEAQPLQLYIRKLDLEKVFKKQAGENILFQLQIKGGEQDLSKTAMIKELQRHPVSRAYLHTDFYEISLTKELDVEVGIRIVGKSPGVEKGGILQEVSRELTIRCLPITIPDHIEVDVNALEIGDSIHVRDLQLAPGIKILTDPLVTIVNVVPPMEEKPVEGAAEASGEVEVVAKKGKAKEEA
ncbi:MAG: 50S ribosomal protein L25/general stress protein Ctc [Deltaproteobacteria bacterium]|nr:50S ribosomal protein L25/general stress protein Ctc [Deltaproteobacteria bacterium]